MFDTWMFQVNHWLSALYGVHSDDLPDCRYLDWFEDGVGPKAAALRAWRSSM